MTLPPACDNTEVLRKGAAAFRWCENAPKLTGSSWKYTKVPQEDFAMLQARHLADLAALQAQMFE